MDTAPTGHRLNRHIAERLGWSARQKETTAGNRYFEIYAPGEDIAETYDDSLSAAWDLALRHSIPNYADDTDAALTLIESIPHVFTLNSPAPGMWRVWFDGSGSPESNADTPALAICYAWLAYQSR